MWTYFILPSHLTSVISNILAQVHYVVYYIIWVHGICSVVCIWDSFCCIQLCEMGENRVNISLPRSLSILRDIEWNNCPLYCPYTSQTEQWKIKKKDTKWQKREFWTKKLWWWERSRKKGEKRKNVWENKAREYYGILQSQWWMITFRGFPERSSILGTKFETAFKSSGLSLKIKNLKIRYLVY